MNPLNDDWRNRNMMTIKEQLKEARETRNASLLDLALRAQYHFNHKNQVVDTTDIQFTEVRALDPKFYV